MGASIIAIVAGLVTLLPQIIAILERKRSTKDALAKRSLNELDAGLQRVRHQPPV